MRDKNMLFDCNEEVMDINFNEENDKLDISIRPIIDIMIHPPF